MTRTIALVCLSIAPSAAVGFAEERTWTDTTGRSMKAEFLRLEGTDAVFRKEGKEVTVPISRLSPQDRDAVVELSEQGGTDNPFEVLADGEDSPATSTDAAEKPQRTEQRMWTDAQGRQLKAKFVRINGLNVVLNRSGRISIVPYYNLSPVDQDYVAELLKERGEEDKVPPPPARGNQGGGTSGSYESSPGGGAGGPPGMPGASGPFPGGMPGGIPGARYPGGGFLGGGSGPGFPGSMPSLPPMPSGMPGMPGGSSFPGSSPPSGFPGSSPSPGLGGSGYPGSMPSAGGYPGGSSSPPGMAGGSSPSMGPGSSYPGSSSPSYPSTLGGPHGGSSMMDSGSSAMGGPSGMSGMGGPFGMGGAPPMPDLPRFEFVYKCSQCQREFSESQSKGKTHCPSCGVAWLNQGGTAGTFDKSAPQYDPQGNSSRISLSNRAIVKLVIAAIAFVVSLLGGGATAYSRWNKS